MHQKQVLASTYLEVDETPIRVLDKQKKGTTHRGYHWVYYSPEQKLVLFNHQPSRGRAGPAKLLQGFQGYLQSDGYSVYEPFDQFPGITLVGCLTHAQRKFEHALANDKLRAEKVLRWMQQLYALEREAKERGFTSQQRYELRKEKACPILNELKQWLEAEQSKLLPKSAIGKAVQYLLSRFQFIVSNTGKVTHRKGVVSIRDSKVSKDFLYRQFPLIHVQSTRALEKPCLIIIKL